MAESHVHIRALPDTSLALGWAGAHTLTIDRSERWGGTGKGFSSGELLRLAVGACYALSLQREAAQRGIALTRVAIDVQAEWGGEPERVQWITCAVTLDAPASEADIQELVRAADLAGEVTNTLRQGTTIRLVRRSSQEPDAPRLAAAQAPVADAVLEMLATGVAAGALCALLTPAIKERLRELRGGQVLEVRVDDSTSQEDIAAWCRLAGHRLQAVVNDTPEYTRYFISKKLS